MDAVLLLGGNIGDVKATLDAAGTGVRERIGPVLAYSRDHWSAPWGFSDDRLFLNRALLVRTAREPEALMKEALAIERDLGRVRDEGPGYSARTIDIDVLFIGDRVISTPTLTVPHPLVQLRPFALGPAADIVPDLVHPVLHRTVLTLLNDVRRKA